MKIILKYIKIVLITCIIFLLLIAFGAEVTKVMPDNADVMVDDIAKIYYSPMYFFDYPEKDGWQNLRLTKASEARQLGYNPDYNCRNAGYFVDDRGAVFWSWLEDVGIYVNEKRWNPDGSWNW